MAKAKAGQSARKRQERERERAAHREVIVEDIPERSTPGSDSGRDTHGDGADTVPARPAINQGLDQGSTEANNDDQWGSASHPVQHVEVTPYIQAGPDRSIDAPPIETANVIRDQAMVNGTLSPDDEPSFARVPRVSSGSRSAGASDMDASQTSPRGRMTDRYTVWSGSASRSADPVTPKEASQPAVQASEPVIPATETSDVDAADHGHGDTGGSADRAVPDTVANQPAPSAGIDLAMSRLQSATGATESGSGPDTATAAGDDIGSTESALDGAVDQFIAASRTVETTISEPPTTVGTTSDPDRSGQAAGTTDAGAHDAPADHSGAAGLLDDLAGRLGSSGTRVRDALGQSRDDVGDGMDAQTGRIEGPARRASELVQQGRDRGSETVDQVRSTVGDAAADLKDSVDDALSQVQDAGSDIAGSVKEAGQSTTEDLVEAAGQVGDRVQTAGGDVASTVEDGLEKAEDRVEHAAEQIAETTAAAAHEVVGAVGRAIHDVRDQVTGTAHDLLTIGRDTVTDARTIATDTAADVRSGITDAAGSIAGTGRAAAAAITGRAAEVMHSLTGSASEAASGLSGTVRSGLGKSDAAASNTAADSAGSASPERSYNRLILSTVTLGTVSGFNRWAVRRLTGADIAILGPATIHPAILGTGLAALIASLYLTEE